MSPVPASLDIHDGLIVGTAIMYRDRRGATVALLTRDAAIQASGLIATIW